MRRAVYSLLWATVMASVVLAPARVAVAGAGTTTSAGNQQYLDPLGSTTTSTAPASPSAGAPAPVASAPPPVVVSAPRSHDPAGRTLPYTGLNLWPLVGIGVGLILAGLILRRLTRRRDVPG